MPNITFSFNLTSVKDAPAFGVSKVHTVVRLRSLLGDNGEVVCLYLYVQVKSGSILNELIKVCKGRCQGGGLSSLFLFNFFIKILTMNCLNAQMVLILIMYLLMYSATLTT